MRRHLDGVRVGRRRQIGTRPHVTQLGGASSQPDIQPFHRNIGGSFAAIEERDGARAAGSKRLGPHLHAVRVRTAHADAETRQRQRILVDRQQLWIREQRQRCGRGRRHVGDREQRSRHHGPQRQLRAVFALTQLAAELQCARVVEGARAPVSDTIRVAVDVGHNRRPRIADAAPVAKHVRGLHPLLKAFDVLTVGVRLDRERQRLCGKAADQRRKLATARVVGRVAIAAADGGVVDAGGGVGRGVLRFVALGAGPPAAGRGAAARAQAEPQLLFVQIVGQALEPAGKLGVDANTAVGRAH